MALPKVSDLPQLVAGLLEVTSNQTVRIAALEARVATAETFIAEHKATAESRAREVARLKANGERLARRAGRRT